MWIPGKLLCTQNLDVCMLIFEIGINGCAYMICIGSLRNPIVIGLFFDIFFSRKCFTL